MSGGIALTEIALHLCLTFGRLTPWGKLASLAPGALLGSAAFVSALFTLKSARGFGVFVAVCTLGMVAITKFRGPYVWPGTFDAYWLSPNSWWVGGAIGALAGIGVSTVTDRFQVRSAGSVVKGLVFTFGVGIGTFLTGRLSPLDSVYPEMLSIALLSVAALLSLTLYVESTNAQQSV